MTAEDPADRAMGGQNGANAPFDLGDSRDLAAAVRATWSTEKAAHPSTPTSEVPRPPLERRGSGATKPVVTADGGGNMDPLAHLRGEAGRGRVGWRIPRSVSPSSLWQTQRRAVLALAGVVAAIAFTASIPLAAQLRPPPPADSGRDEPVRRTPTTLRQTPPTTVFTYPPEQMAEAEPAPASEPEPTAAVRATTPLTAAPTPTTSGSRSTSTTRSAPRTTQAPSRPPPTTQAPPPDDGSGDYSEPPPYP